MIITDPELNPLDISSVRGCTDIAILTVRPDEFEAVLKRFPDRRPVIGGKNRYEYATVEDGGGRTTVAIARIIEQGPGIAQAIARNTIEDLEPSWLLLVGIAGGVPDTEYSLGDVILASRLHDFSVSAALQGQPPTYESAGGPMHLDVERFLSAIPGYRDRLNGWNSEDSIGVPKPVVEIPSDTNSNKYYGSHDWRAKVEKSLLHNFPHNGTKRNPSYLVGPTASSGILLKDDSLLGLWLKSARAVYNVEMELGGVYLAARYGGNQQVRVLAIRGISDIVGLHREEQWTQYACHSAAALGYAIIRTGILDFGQTMRLTADSANSAAMSANNLSSNGDGRALYSLAKERSNSGQYQEASNSFIEAGLAFEKEKDYPRASKSYACASWNLIPLKEFSRVNDHLIKAAELDTCFAIEGHLNAVYWCAYYEKISKQQAKPDSEQYHQRAIDHLLSAITLIYEWNHFDKKQLVNQKKKINQTIHLYMNYILEDFFKKKEAHEKKINEEWIRSNIARRANIKESVGLKVEKTYEEAELTRFFRTASFINRIQRAALERKWDEIIKVVSGEISQLPGELTSLPIFLQLKHAVDHIADEKNTDGLGALLTDALKAINDVFTFRLTELEHGVNASKLRSNIVAIIDNKMAFL